MKLYSFRSGTTFGVGSGKGVQIMAFCQGRWVTEEGTPLRSWHTVQVSRPTEGMRCLFQGGVEHNANGQPRILRDLGDGYYLIHQPGTKGWGDRLRPSVYYPASLRLLQRKNDTWYEVAEIDPLGKGQRKAAEAALCALVLK